MNLQLAIALAVVGFLVFESVLMGRSRSGIPHRIVVTGTRGKSSLVRILAAGVRATEPHTWGKITGDAPLLLAPDGSETLIRRRSPARLHEQKSILWKCRRKNARCLVLESMTITPEAMQAEMRLVRPTMVVLTNVRDDHRETLGSDPAAQRAAYLQAIPPDVPLVTEDGLPAARGFPEELVGLAEKVLEELGWNTPVARKAMQEVAEGLVRGPSTLNFQGRTVRLLDGFSANDPESLTSLWNDWRRKLKDTSAWPILLATRADRPLRTRQFCDWLAERRDVGVVHVAGNHQGAATRLLKARGLKVAPFAAGGGTPTARDATGDCLDVLVGIGNAKGLGLHLRAEAEGVVGR